VQLKGLAASIACCSQLTVFHHMACTAITQDAPTSLT
jgi:hypothetical protein